MRILTALILPAVVATTFKTCVLDAPCDVCGPDEALFPVEGGVYANSGICVSKTR